MRGGSSKQEKQEHRLSNRHGGIGVAKAAKADQSRQPSRLPKRNLQNARVTRTHAQKGSGKARQAISNNSMVLALHRVTREPQSKPGKLEGSKGQSQPYIDAAAFLMTIFVQGFDYDSRSLRTSCLLYR